MISDNRTPLVNKDVIGVCWKSIVLSTGDLLHTTLKGMARLRQPIELY